MKSPCSSSSCYVGYGGIDRQEENAFAFLFKKLGSVVGNRLGVRGSKEPDHQEPSGPCTDIGFALQAD